MFLILRYFLKHFENIYGKSIGPVSKEDAIEKIKNQMAGQDIEFKADIVDGQIVTVFVTPFMKRVSSHIQNAKEMLFIDTSSSMDRFVI